MMIDVDDSYAMRRRFYTRCCRLLAFGLCTFLIIAYSGHYILNKTSLLSSNLPQHARYVLNRAFPDNNLELLAESSVAESVLSPERNDDTSLTTGEEVWVECENLCKGNMTETCIPLESAILAYRQEVPSQKMRFRQLFHPKTYRNVDMDVPRISTDYVSIRNCPIEVYFKQFSSTFLHESCAVVGNGGILLDSNCGHEIDAHDFIIRANLKPIQNYTQDVGSKCNVTAFNVETQKDLYNFVTLAGSGNKDHQMFLQRLRYLNDSILWFPKSTKKMYVREELKKIAHAVREKNNLPIRMAYSWKAISVERDWGLDGYATNGFNMFAIAKTFCKHISLYGFYPFQKDSSGRHIPHHYFAEDKEFQYQTAEHDFVIEFNKLNELHERGEIKLVSRRCR